MVTKVEKSLLDWKISPIDLSEGELNLIFMLI